MKSVKSVSRYIQISHVVKKYDLLCAFSDGLVATLLIGVSQNILPQVKFQL